MLSSLEKPIHSLFENKNLRLLLFFVLLTLSLLLRFALSPNLTDDVTSFYLPWYHYILAHGGLNALKDGFSINTPPYLYLLVLGTYPNFISPVIVIKFIAFSFDFIAGWLVYKIISLRYPHKPLPWIAFFTILFSPVVFILSAYWGQVDIIYTVFLLAFTYAILKDKPFLAMIYFSIALTFKLQAVFIAPVILLLVLRKKIYWQHLLLPAPVYLIMALPAWLAGRKLSDLFLIYFQQADAYQSLSKNAPNPYSFFPNSYYSVLMPVALFVTFLAVLVFLYFAFKKKQCFTPENFLIEAVLVLSLLPFLLPKMHERYFYAATLFAILLAFYQPRFVFIAILYQLTSLLSYLPYLKGYPEITVNIAAVGNLGIIVYLIYAYFLVGEKHPYQGQAGANE